MAVWSTIFSSQVLREHRSDAEFFKPEYAQLDAYLERVPVMADLRALSFFVKKGIFDISPTKYQVSGIPLIRTFQIKSPITNDESLVYLSENDHKAEFSKTELLAGDIVFTKIGAGIGDVAILSRKYPIYNFSQNVAGLSVNRSIVNPYYLIAYLISKLGRKQILRYMMPSGQGKLELRDIKKIRIARLDAREDKIAGLVQESERLVQESAFLHADAQQRLESELGLEKLTFQKPAGYTARCSEIELSRRSDAQHFQPAYAQLLEHLNPFTTRRVRDIRTYNRRGVQPVYVNDGSVDVVNSQHLGPKHIDYDGLQKTSPTAFAAVPEAHIQIDDILIYSTGAYVGRTNVYLTERPALASNHVNILRVTSGIDPAYMALVFQSIIGQFQTQKHVRGSAQAELYPADIDRFVVPLLDYVKQEAIGDLVRASLEKQRESKRLLEEAKIRVEQLIEEALKK